MTKVIEARTDNTDFASGGVICILGAMFIYTSTMLIDP
mgnify:CR=1 FL=1